MQTQFEVFIDNLGNVSMSRGMVLDLTGAQPEYFPVGESSADDPLNATFRLSSNSTTEFSGGSGENIFVSGSLTNPAILTFGHFRKTALSSWSNKSSYNITFNSTTLLHEISDGTGVIATFAGLEMRRDLYECASLATSGGQGNFTYEVFLGTGTGTVDFSYSAFTIPDQFTVKYNGANVINTGLVGTSGYYNGVYVSAGASPGSASFTKTSANPQYAYVTVTAPFAGTAWSFTLGCPGGASNATPARPPGTPSDDTKLLFTATSTAYGQGLNGSAFTLDVIYENVKSTSDFICTATVQNLANVDDPTIPIVAGIYSAKGYSRWVKTVLVPIVSSPQQIYIYSNSTFPALTYTETSDRVFTNGSYVLQYVGSSSYEYSLSDGTAIVAYLPANGASDPQGNYLATAYCETTYGVPFGLVANTAIFPSSAVYFDLYSKYDGSAELHDGTAVVATIAQTDQLVPIGNYTPTTYGKDTYNFGENFEILFSNTNRVTAAGWFYIQVNLSGSSVTSVKGPFFKNFLPDNTSTLKNIPIAYSNGNGTVDQIHEGVLIFK